MIDRLAGTRALWAAGVALVTTASWAQPLLVVQTAPMRELAPDPMDAGLVRAIEMLPARVEELSSEVPDLDRSVTQLVARLMRTVSRPMTLAVVHDPDQDGPTMGYGAVLSFAMDSEESAMDLQRELIGALALSGETPAPQPAPQAEGMMQLVQPNGVPIVFGPRNAGGAWRYELHVGFVDQSWDLLPPADAEHKGRAVARMSVDLAALSPVLEMARREADQQGRPMLSRVLDDVADAGLAGDGAMSIDLAMSYQDDHSLTSMRLSELGRLWDKLSLPTGAIDRDHFRLVPADAWTASFSRFDLEMVRAIVDKLEEYEVPARKYVQYFAESTGVDLFADIVEPLGGDAIVYRSESTGGGGVLSSVMLLQVRDHDRMLATNRKLSDLANMMTMMVPVAGKYVRIVPWQYEGEISLYSLRFQGVPVPLELTFGYEGEWMVVAPTPQGAIAAVRQIRGQGDRGLGTVQAFTTQLPKGQDLYSASFVNADRVARGGYALTALLGSGLANMVRSPWDRTRDPGLVVPPYNDLKEQMRSRVSWSSWHGSTLEYRSVGGRSLVAGMVVELGRSGGGGVGSLLQLAGVVAGQSARQGSFGWIEPQEFLIDAATDPLGQALLAATLAESN